MLRVNPVFSDLVSERRTLVVAEDMLENVAADIVSAGGAHPTRLTLATYHRGERRRGTETPQVKVSTTPWTGDGETPPWSLRYAEDDRRFRQPERQIDTAVFFIDPNPGHALYALATLDALRKTRRVDTAVFVAIQPSLRSNADYLGACLHDAKDERRLREIYRVHPARRRFEVSFEANVRALAEALVGPLAKLGGAFPWRFARTLVALDPKVDVTFWQDALESGEDALQYAFPARSADDAAAGALTELERPTMTYNLHHMGRLARKCPWMFLTQNNRRDGHGFTTRVAGRAFVDILAPVVGDPALDERIAAWERMDAEDGRKAVDLFIRVTFAKFGNPKWQAAAFRRTGALPSGIF